MSLIESLSKFSFQIPGPQDAVNHLYWWSVRLQKRHEIKQLLDQEDWVLKDMGLTRDDVRAALKYRGDPALYLDRSRGRTICAETQAAKSKQQSK